MGTILNGNSVKDAFLFEEKGIIKKALFFILCPFKIFSGFPDSPDCD